MPPLLGVGQPCLGIGVNPRMVEFPGLDAVPKNVGETRLTVKIDLRIEVSVLAIRKSDPVVIVVDDKRVTIGIGGVDYS